MNTDPIKLSVYKTPAARAAEEAKRKAAAVAKLNECESEKEIETRLRCLVKINGGECLKFESESAAGWPDRLCIMPDGVTLYVELKKCDGKLSPLQRERIKRLASLGHRVFVIRSKREAEQMMRVHGYNKVK